MPRASGRFPRPLGYFCIRPFSNLWLSKLPIYVSYENIITNCNYLSIGKHYTFLSPSPYPQRGIQKNPAQRERDFRSNVFERMKNVLVWSYIPSNQMPSSSY